MPTRTASLDAPGQRVRPQQGASPKLVAVEERVAELEQRRAESILARLDVPLDQLVGLERAQEPVHGRLRDAQPLGQLGHAQSRLTGAELAEDRRRATDRLDHADLPAARSKAAISSAADVAPGSCGRRCGGRGTTLVPSSPASGSVAGARLVRGLASTPERHRQRLAGAEPALEPGDRRFDRVDHGLVARAGRAEAADLLECRAPDPEHVLAVEGRRVAERPSHLADRWSRTTVPAAPPTDNTSDVPMPSSIAPRVRWTPRAGRARSENPRSMLTPWSASPIAASSCVRKSRCSWSDAAASRIHRDDERRVAPSAVVPRSLAPRSSPLAPA